MNMRTYPLLCFLMLGFGCIPASGYAQFWQDIPIQDIPIRPLSGKRIIQPATARGLSLDLAQIAQRCASAPLERTWAASNTQTLLPLPMPDGSQRVFRILESPIMESELATQFPEIETFSGTDINDPSTTVRFDLTPQGFHAMILSPHFSTVFIDPYFFGGNDQTHYLSYHRADYRSLIPKTFECLTPANPTHAAALAQPRFADCRLRTYRLALAATGEYTAFHGGTVALALAAQVTTMNRVNGIFEREIAVRMNIINNNNLLIYTDPSTDPYTNGAPSTMINENQTNVNTVIGTANYDIGHVFGTNSGGLAAGGSVCRTSKARGVTGSSAPIGDPFDVDYVAHEVGHQFGANHSFNNSCGGNVNATTAMETGSGSTIMSYAGICAPDVQNQVNDYFHSVSLQEMGAFITGGTHTCPVNTALANSSPVISSPSGTQQFSIPISTPFALTAAATDPNAGDVLTYCWEQYDNQISTQPPVASAPDGPNFRSFSPNTSPTRYFPNLNALRLGTTTTWEVLPSVSRSMRFRVTVRDNASGGGCTADAFMSVSTVSTAGPFVVTAPNVSSITWTGNTSQTVSWNVAGTNLAPISCANVDIRLSTDGGLTYPTVLASNVPNTGSATITAPNINSSTARVQVFCSNNIFFDISNQNFSIVVGTCALSVALASTSITCNSVCNGNINSTVSNGVAPYVYVWSNANTTANITGLCSSTYSLTVTDANACTTTAQASISQPSALSASTATTNVSCLLNDGTASVSVSGGTAPYAYLWSNGRTTSNMTGLTANTYSLTITDANVCQLVRTATVGNGCAPCAVSLSLSSANISCNGGTNGTISSNITGANGAISYLWSNNSTTANLSGLAANTYSLTITDANSCTATAQSTLSQPTALSASTATSNASCVGNDGTASASVSGGTAPYAYLWSNGRTTSNLTGLTANTYNLTITDANACQLLRTATVGNGCIPCAVSLSLNSSNLSCNGVCNGAISANISGATTPITYLWSNNSTTANISGLCAGTYSLTVTDANACTATAQNTLSQPTALSASAATTNVSCLGNDGTATATVSGGTAPYAYLWSNGRTTANMTGLTANTYSLTITDANACRLVQTATVGVTCIPCTVSLSLSSTNLTCNGGASGSIASNVTGANGAVVYFWSNGRTTANLSNLNASTYSLTITDSNNCTATAQSTLSQPTALSLVTSSNPTACNMGGTASVTMSGGVAPYAYAWSNGATISNLTGLSIGNYPIVVRDANNCSITSTVSVVNGCFCSLTISPSISQPACNNSCNGQIALSLSGTAGAVSIIWTGGQTAQTLSGLCAGTYRVTVTDANNCSAIGSNLVLNNPSVLSASTSISNASCNGADGRAGIQVTGGTGAYTYAWSSGQNSQTATGLNVGAYSVSVTDANNCILTSTANVGLTNTLAVTNPIINQNPNCFGANNGSAFVSAAGANNIRFLWTSGETNSNASALNAGLNQVTVSAAGGCVVVRSVQLNSPTQIRANISNTHTVCTPNSGILIANATNGGSGSGYQFVWSNGRSGSVQTGLSSGNYTLTITDGTGCSAISSTQISISTPPTLSATHTNPTCLAGGNINLSISPAANYTFLWSNGATTQNLSGIQGGIYTVEARNGTCVVSLRDTVPAVLPLVIGFSTTQPTSANSNNGSVSAAVSNGLAPFSYVWNNTSTSNVLLGIGAGNYQVTATDANGCTATNSVNLNSLTNVSQSAQLLDEFSVYPNPSAGVFGVKIGFLETQNFELQVVDMLGQVLFRQQYTSQQFQTQIDLSAYSTGIYLLRLQTDTIQKTIKIISKTN